MRATFALLWGDVSSAFDEKPSVKDNERCLMQPLSVLLSFDRQHAAGVFEYSD